MVLNSWIFSQIKVLSIKHDHNWLTFGITNWGESSLDYNWDKKLIIVGEENLPPQNASLFTWRKAEFNKVQMWVCANWKKLESVRKSIHFVSTVIKKLLQGDFCNYNELKHLSCKLDKQQ